MMLRQTGFPPCMAPNTRVLILGSLPGVASLKAGEYYAHPRNQFWAIWAELLHCPLLDLPYAARLAQLQAHGIGLWDVIHSAQRSGSLDTDLRQIQINPLPAFIAQWPTLSCIAFNGQTAGKAAKILPPTLPHFILPSTSPAHTLKLAHKISAWRTLLPYL